MRLHVAVSPLVWAIALVTAAPAHAASPATGTPADPATAADIDRIVVKAQRYLPAYTTRNSSTATKTDTPLVDVPQAATVVTEELIRDQAMAGINDVLRYVPGAGVAQGEGNRDTPVLRGNATTGDFFVDGVRDDVQYIRDLYNIERVEVLKGPNAMIFGRGGSGGIVNRVSKRAIGADGATLSLQWGTWDRKRAALDWKTAISRDAGFRLNAMLEESGSFRDGFALSRRGVNPVVALQLGERSTLDLSYEHFRDDRVADRGVTSWQGKPLAIDRAIFLGNPEQSPVTARVDAFDAVLAHAFANGVEVRNHLRWADYAKFYQNIFGNGTTRNADGSFNITLAAYANDTQRRNWFNQTDVEWHVSTGGVRHTVLAGLELGEQNTRNLRTTGVMPLGNTVPLASPRYPGHVGWVVDGRNAGTARITGVYVQDQIAFSPQWQAIIGVRHDHFRLQFDDLFKGGRYRSDDRLWSPRAGLIWKPAENMSVYASTSIAFQPRGGDQLGSLSASNQALQPEKFVNKEVGFKWDVREDLALTAALYRLDRRNVAVVDPLDPKKMLLVDGQLAQGLELGIAGHLTERWQVMGGYAWQTGEILATQSASAPKGNWLAQLPRHSASLWNRVDLNDRFGVALGVVYRSALFPSTDNKVIVPGFVRWDAAAFYTVHPRLQLQLNVENLFNMHYYASAHSNNNISPGAPRGAMLSARISF